MVNILKKVLQGVEVVDKTLARLQGINYRGSSNLSETSARFAGKGSTTDWRVRLSLPPDANQLQQAIFGGGNFILDPLKASNGIFWPLTPSIVIQHSANYNALAQTHSNYPFQAYQNSQVDQINIIGEFPVQNSDDAKHWVATVHFLRTITKMFFGGNERDALKGNPPPILFLNGYGDNVFKNVPVVVNTFNVELRSGIDYISTQASYDFDPGNGFVDQGGFGEFGGADPNDQQKLRSNTYAPTLSNISVLVTPIYSRESVARFSLSDFAKSGQINVRGEKIGFI